MSLLALVLGLPPGCDDRDGPDAGTGEDLGAGMPDLADPPPDLATLTSEACDVAVIGGGLGGVAATLAIADRGLTACLTDPNQWLGGQATSQGVSAFDGTSRNRLWQDLERRIRARYAASPFVPVPDAGAPINPGDCWVSLLCFEPQVAASAIGAMVAERAPRVKLFLETEPVSVEKSGDVVTAVVVRSAAGAYTRLSAPVTIDASELGDLLPMAGAAYRTGMEAQADTGEPSAPLVGDPECVQPMTSTFLLERRPGTEDHTIAPPPGYDPSRYTLSLPPSAPTARFYLFTAPRTIPGGATLPGYETFSFWRYRRSLAASQFTSGAPFDVAMINWGPYGNDYDRDCVDVAGARSGAGCNVIDRDPATRAAIFERIRSFTLGYVYWLQHDAPHDNDDGGKGYPNLRLVTDGMGSPDGISQHPYVREARRVRALTTIREQDISKVLLQAADPARQRARLYDDAVSTGFYAMDLHKCATGTQAPMIADGSGTLPFQVPLGALVPMTVDGLLVGAKNLGVTHLTNGAYRLHPIEWNIGFAAGEAAALAAQSGVAPRQLVTERARLRTLQARIIQAGGELCHWWDVAHDTPLSAIVLLASAVGGLDGFAGQTTAFGGGFAVTRADAAVGVIRAADRAPVTLCAPSFPNDVPCTHPAYGFVQALAQLGGTSGCAASSFCPDTAITRAQLAVFLAASACGGQAGCLVGAITQRYADVPLAHVFASQIETLASWGVFADDPAIVPSGGRPSTNFQPDLTVTRETLARWVARYTRHRYPALP